MSARNVVLTIPPIMGAAIRFITSAPVPEVHMMGRSPKVTADAVMRIGRTRRLAPSTIAARRSARVLSKGRASKAGQQQNPLLRKYGDLR